MNFKSDIDWKSLVIGSAISATIVIIASNGYDLLYAASAVGLIYVGYKAKTIKMGAILGAVAATPLVYLALNGTLGPISTIMFNAETMIILITLLVLAVGAMIGAVGGYAYKSRQKAIKEQERKAKIGKNKKNKKK